ncbi:MAG: DUF881 domain-containing protein [Bacillota bacterium]|nr:DUF881 domain-containing protein [Bacillota bacterium]
MNKQPQKKTDLTFWVVLLLLLLGLFLYGRHLLEERRSEGQKSVEELAHYIEKAEKEGEALHQEILRLQEELLASHKEESEGKGLISTLTAALETLQLAAGLSAVQGPGLIITLQDNKEGAEQAQASKPASYNPASYIVHDKDLLYLIRALAPAAEALSLNELRITDCTAIRCLGSVILVNSSRLTPPYEIKAIGEPSALQAALNNSDRYRALLRTHIPIEIRAEEKIEIAAYSGSCDFSHGRVSERN